jgi:hypothetical protein
MNYLTFTITRSEIPRSAGKQFPVGWASRPSSFPRTRESSTGRDAGAYDLVAAGVPARHFPAPGSESGVTNDRQDAGPTDEIASETVSKLEIRAGDDLDGVGAVREPLTR